jgi:hypothetical protein
MTTFLKAITDTLDAVLQEQADRLPVRPVLIQGLAAIPDELKNLSVGTDDWSVLERWVDKLRRLLGPDSQPLAESLLFRAIEYHLPRIAGTFVVLGLIEHTFVGDVLQSHRIAWPRVFTFLTQPQTLFEYWKSKIQHSEDVQLLQVYLPTLIYAPLGFLNLEHRRQGFSALPAALPLRPELDDLLNKTVRSPTPLLQPPSGLIDVPAFVQLVQQARAAPQPPFASFETNHAGPIGPDILQKIDLDAKLTMPNPTSSFVGLRFNAGNGWSVGVSSAAPAGQTLELHRQGGHWSSDGGVMQGELLALDVSKNGSPALSLGDSRFLLIEIARLKLLITLRAPDSPGAGT